MEKLQNLKDRICSLENLYSAYFSAIEGKRYRDEILLYTLDLDRYIFELREELLAQTYAVGKYREFYVHYPKARLVMALGFRDRIVQWAIYRQINPYVDKRYDHHSYGCRKGKGTLAAAEQLLDWIRLIDRKPDSREWAILKCDISKYFYRIDHRKALELYSRISDDPWFMWLMAAIIDNPEVPFGLPPGMRADNCPRELRLFDVGMPIGNLTSQETANLYLDRLDQFCKHELRQHFYIRYMDDFIILCKRAEAERMLGQIERFLRAELLLDLSPKTHILPIHTGCEFVGYDVTPHGLRLRKRTERHIKRALLYVAELYGQGLITFDEALATTRSYLGLTQHCNGYNLRRWIEDNVVFVEGGKKAARGEIIYERAA